MEYDHGVWFYKGFKSASVVGAYNRYHSWLGAQRFHGIRK